MIVPHKTVFQDQGSSTRKNTPGPYWDRKNGASSMIDRTNKVHNGRNDYDECGKSKWTIIIIIIIIIK